MSFFNLYLHFIYCITSIVTTVFISTVIVLSFNQHIFHALSFASIGWCILLEHTPHTSTIFVGFNLFIQSGGRSLSTYDNNPNGLGNLILGYNVARKAQTGSHNLVRQLSGWASMDGDSISHVLFSFTVTFVHEMLLQRVIWSLFVRSEMFQT